MQVNVYCTMFYTHLKNILTGVRYKAVLKQMVSQCSIMHVVLYTCIYVLHCNLLFLQLSFLFHSSTDSMDMEFDSLELSLLFITETWSHVLC